mmetsp:Transcript_5145/g.21133  ORF Transcript_5145/g.21133 Transcript_5145/m.21133 type:complete len:292 (+) Transcript_5145:616-1491(+)
MPRAPCSSSSSSTTPCTREFLFPDTVFLHGRPPDLATRTPLLPYNYSTRTVGRSVFCDYSLLRGRGNERDSERPARSSGVLRSYFFQWSEASLLASSIVDHGEGGATRRSPGRRRTTYGGLRVAAWPLVVLVAGARWNLGGDVRDAPPAAAPGAAALVVVDEVPPLAAAAAALSVGAGLVSARPTMNLCFAQSANAGRWSGLRAWIWSRRSARSTTKARSSAPAFFSSSTSRMRRFGLTTSMSARRCSEGAPPPAAPAVDEAPSAPRTRCWNLKVPPSPSRKCGSSRSSVV